MVKYEAENTEDGGEEEENDGIAEHLLCARHSSKSFAHVVSKSEESRKILEKEGCGVRRILPEDLSDCSR